jgi:hypothetical protein
MCQTCNNPAHDDLNDDVFDVFGLTAPVAAPAPVVIDTTLADAQIANTRRFEETCRQCSGSGQFRSWAGRVIGQCFACKGAGRKFYKTSSEDRAKAKASADARKAKAAASAAEQADAWLEANPAAADWLRQPVTGDFTFHADMLKALYTYGALTERQEAAVLNATAKWVARRAQWAAEKAAREQGAATLTLTKIRAGFDSALQHLKRPKLRIADVQFSLAPATGRNAGCIYVVRASDDTYLGKITQDDKFITSRDCTAADSETVARVAADPAAAATAHGHEYGQCSCCGRELTNPESVARGIGPICAERWGW